MRCSAGWLVVVPSRESEKPVAGTLICDEGRLDVMVFLDKWLAVAMVGNTAIS
jgi:hypothetical protein